MSEGRTPQPKPAAANVVLARSNSRIPLSLGKASLRIRLEAYYSLIAPDTLSDRTVWLRKYDQIYEKYGGTHTGERKLATKLAKKYGTAVRLLVVPKNDLGASRTSTASTNAISRGESWYELRPSEAGSGVVNFLSPDFDPIQALNRASPAEIARANPWMEDLHPKTILDNLGKCAALLPVEDPFYKETSTQRVAQLPKQPANTAAVSTNLKRPRTNNALADPHPFDAVASYLDSGPHSLLYRLRNERKRVRIVVRYVNMIRGTITGSLLAFDKHMNMILRDVEEVYSQRIPDENYEKSNLELELERRKKISIGDVPSDTRETDDLPGSWNLRRRQMKQLLVRGDTVVSVYDSSRENTAVRVSRYRKRETTKIESEKGGPNQQKR